MFRMALLSVLLLASCGPQPASTQGVQDQPSQGSQTQGGPNILNASDAERIGDNLRLGILAGKFTFGDGDVSAVIVDTQLADHGLSLIADADGGTSVSYRGRNIIIANGEEVPSIKRATLDLISQVGPILPMGGPLSSAAYPGANEVFIQIATKRGPVRVMQPYDVIFNGSSELSRFYRSSIRIVQMVENASSERRGLEKPHKALIQP